MKRNNKGAATIEFVMGFFMLWLMCMMWVEMSFMSFVSAINDLAIAEAARTAKVSESDYRDVFEQTLKKQNSIWSYVANSDGFHISVQYIQDIDTLYDGVTPCEFPENQNSVECGVQEESAIAIYRTSYAYQPIFAFFIDADAIFGREVIVVQEYERSEFEI